MENKTENKFIFNLEDKTVEFEGEIFKRIPNILEDLYVSKTGKIFNLGLNGIINLSNQNIGYKGFYATKDDGVVRKIPRNLLLVHRAVLSAWIGESDMEIDHIDGDKTNNNIENLEYVTRGENIRRFWERHRAGEVTLDFERKGNPSPVGLKKYLSTLTESEKKAFYDNISKKRVETINKRKENENV